LYLAKRDVDFESSNTEGAGALALVVKEGGADAKYPFGLLLVVSRVPLHTNAIEVLEKR
jgi:hypothetical protein